jgi:hypothetical protein
MRLNRSHTLTAAFAFAPLLGLPSVAAAATVPNPLCSANKCCSIRILAATSLFPRVQGFGLRHGVNAPTGIAFKGDLKSFEVYVLESGHGLPSRCNDQSAFPGGDFASNNPFTPDIRVFNQNGILLRTLAKPTGTGGVQTGGLQAERPAIDIAFERGLEGGRFFATDSNQATHAAGQNNSSRIVTVDPMTGKVTPFITGLPTGDHPTEQLAFKGGWIYWSQDRRPTAASL